MRLSSLSSTRSTVFPFAVIRVLTPTTGEQSFAAGALTVLATCWFYFWMYTGVVMRMAYCVESAAVPESAPGVRLRGPARDPYGWTATGVGR